MRRYLDSRPERFFDQAAFSTCLAWLKKREKLNSKALKEYLNSVDAEIGQALVFLRQINSEGWHDRLIDELTLRGDEYDLIRFVDAQIHPAYLRLVEGVLTPLVRPLAFFSRLDRGKGTDGLDTWAVCQELDGGPATSLVGSCRNTVRNGIGHGGITYRLDEIRYRDKRGNEETLDTSSVVRLCDDLLDTCNGLAAAYRLFFLLARSRGHAAPREVLLEELQEETWSPWWRVEGCVESEVSGNRQLTVFARPDSRRYSKLLWSAVQSGILTEFFAPGYDRYLLSLRSPRSGPGWAVFDGQRLATFRQRGEADLSNYREILESHLLSWQKTPALLKCLGRLDTLIKSFRLHTPLFVEDLRKQRGIPHVVCRNATVHRNGWRAVVNAAVVVEEVDDSAAASLIWRHRGRILRHAAKSARSAGCLRTRLLPVGYAQISVYRRDYRRRRLSGFGLGEDLICTVRLHKIRRITSPDIMGSTVETKGKWRIAWNKAWLEASGQQSGSEVLGS